MLKYWSHVKKEDKRKKDLKGKEKEQEQGYKRGYELELGAKIYLAV